LDGFIDREGGPLAAHEGARAGVPSLRGAGVRFVLDRQAGGLRVEGFVDLFDVGAHIVPVAGDVSGDVDIVDDEGEGVGDEEYERLTEEAEVAQVARMLPAETLLCAVEPEDRAAIPDWLERLRPRRVLLYEAHRPWRELFGLPYLDLGAYARELAGRLADMEFIALEQVGQEVTL